MNLSSLNGTNGFALNGENKYDVISASALTDINGDGYSELLIGAKNYNKNQGRGYVVFLNGNFSPQAPGSSAALLTATQRLSPCTSQPSVIRVEMADIVVAAGSLFVLGYYLFRVLGKHCLTVIDSSQPAAERLLQPTPGIIQSIANRFGTLFANFSSNRSSSSATESLHPGKEQTQIFSL